jgi:hypothetical protein
MMPFIVNINISWKGWNLIMYINNDLNYLKYLQVSKEVGPNTFEAICEMGGKAYDENRCFIVAYK